MIRTEGIDWGNQDIRDSLEVLFLQEVRTRIESALRPPMFGDPQLGAVSYHDHDYGLDMEVAGRKVRVTISLDRLDE